MNTLDDKLGEELFRCSNGKPPIFLIGNKLIVYDILNNIERVRDVEMGRPLDDISNSNSAYTETITQVRNRGGHQSDRAILKPPFSFVGFYAERIGSIYSGAIILFSETSDNFGYINNMREQFDFLGLTLDYDTCVQKGILNEEDVIRYTLRVDNEQKSLHVSFGNHGPRSVDFPESKGVDNTTEIKLFTNELARLEKVVNEIAYKGYEDYLKTPFKSISQINPF